MSDALNNDAAPRSGRLAKISPAGWLLGLSGLALVLLGLAGDEARSVLRYERGAVQGGEYWRLLTSHLVHGSTQHLLLNAGGLLLIGALFPREYSARAWVFIALVSAAAIDIGFVFYEPQLSWYVGASGVLHGLLAAGAVAWRLHQPRLPALGLAAILVGKLAWEQAYGALPLSGDLPVVVDAHLYGALGGALAAALLAFQRRDWLFGKRPL